MREVMNDERGAGLGLAIMTVMLLVLGLLAGYWFLNIWQMMPKSVIVIQGEPVVSAGTLYVTIKNVGTERIVIRKIIIEGRELSFTIEVVEGDVDSQSRTLGPGAVALIKVSGIDSASKTGISFVIVTSAGIVKGSATVT